MADGTRTSRTTVASIAIAVARPERRIGAHVAAEQAERSFELVPAAEHERR